MSNKVADVAVVGGSLVGLATAIGLCRVGMTVHVYEQNVDAERGGTGLGVDRTLLSALTGTDARIDGVVAALPVVDEGYRETSTWLCIHTWLRSLADLTRGLTFSAATRVDEVRSDGDSAYLNGPQLNATADLVLGADGYRSVVRRSVAPEHPFAPYGGFIIWRGLVPESVLPEAWMSRIDLGGGITPYGDSVRLVLYRVPGLNGETAPGQRSINFAWYDSAHTDWLRGQGLLTGDEILGSVGNALLDADLKSALRRVGSTRWGAAAQRILVAAIDTDLIFGTPLTQYLPDRLVADRVAIIGDAAHVASPMVGAGLSSGWLDGLSLVRALGSSGGAAGAAGVRALRRYETQRLADNRDRVLESQLQTRALLQHGR